MALPRIRLVMFDVLHTLISPRLPIHVQYSQTFAPYLGMLEPESLKHSFNIGKLSVAPVSSINVNSSAERTSGRKACISEPRRDTGLVERGYQKDGSWSWGRCARYVGILVCCARDIFTKSSFPCSFECLTSGDCASPYDAFQFEGGVQGL